MLLIYPARFAAALLVVAVPLSARAATYYVAPTGSDTAAGSMAAPFATVERGQQAAVAGDTVMIRGGIYTFSGTNRTVGVNFTKSGGTNNPINYFAFPGETPIFDLFNVLPQARVTGLNVQCNWIHIRGLEVRGVQQIITGDCWGVRVQGNNNVIEGVNSHDNEAPGFFITSGSNNLILNCDSHNNYDPLEAGGNADGFGCHSAGGGNVFSGCRSYDNSDDGFDFINAAGTCTAEKSFSFRNGFRPGTTTAAGNGAGFKAGGFGSPPMPPSTGVPRHTIRNCVAFGNRSQGFYANHHPGGIDFFNNTGFRNQTNYNMLADAGFPSAHTLRNNVAMAPGTAISSLSGGTDTFNSWTLGVTVSAADFVNMTEADVLNPRGADFSLPDIGFVHLVAGSDLIDKGTNVNLPFVGTAPDLGAFEFGAPTGTGTGGTTGTGTGGTTGTGTGGATGTGVGTGTGGATGTGVGTGTGGGTGTAGTGGPGTAGTSGTTGIAGSGGGSVGPGTGGSGDPTGTGGAGAPTGTAGNGGTTPTGGSGGPGPGESSAATGGCGCSSAQGSGTFGGLALLAFVAVTVAAARRRTRGRD